MYLNNKPSEECNGVERYCKSMIEQELIDFYPI